NLNTFYCTTTITRSNKRKQQLKAARAKKCTKKSHVFRKQTNYKDLVWSDQNIDKRAFDYFAVLLIASKNEKIWKPLNRPSTYVGGSERNQRHKKVKLKKATQYTRSITTYFASTLTCESSTELHISTEVESIEMEPVDVKSVESIKLVNMESVESVEVELVEVESVEVEPVKMESVEVEPVKLESVEVELVEVQKLDQVVKTSKRDRSKFTKVLSLLDNERISMKALKQKQSYAKKQHGNNLENWDSNANGFMLMMSELEPLLLEYDDKDLTILIKKNILFEEKRHCVITHDETTLSANNNEKSRWARRFCVRDCEQKIRSKEQDRGIHVSEFLCELLGCAHLTEERHAAHPKIPNRYITELLEIGTNYEGYCKVELLAKQLERAIDILEIALPNTIFVFGFDNCT
ncbi:15684_t:CDS:2, partial [Gigaspora rosea]